MARGNLRLELRAVDSTPSAMRHALSSFLKALKIPEDRCIDIVTASGEALANAVEHAYPQSDVGGVELNATMERPDSIMVEVIDRGAYVEPTERSNRGFGMRIVRAVAQSVEIDTAEGTAIRMTFHVARS
jgi:anti-sigma regulatory factor (Ser/Thr protein kinase)